MYSVHVFMINIRNNREIKNLGVLNNVTNTGQKKKTTY